MADGTVCQGTERLSRPTEQNAGIMWPAGKKAAGRLLHGRTWDERPDPLAI